MIAYYGPYSARLGAAAFLGVDAIIVPAEAPKPAAPTLLPQGPQPVEPAPPVPAPPPGPTVITIGGRQVTVASVVIATAITVGAFALVAASISSYNR